MKIVVFGRNSKQWMFIFSDTCVSRPSWMDKDSDESRRVATVYQIYEDTSLRNCSTGIVFLLHTP